MLLVVSLLLQSALVDAVAADTRGGENLAEGRPVTASAVNSAAEGAGNAVNGRTTDHWVSTEGSAHWLRVDLGRVCKLSRYVVHHAHSGGDLAVYNTRDFRFQVSRNGIIFRDIDSVIRNSESVTDRKISALGRYVRLYITRGAQKGQSNFARIRDMEIYGDVLDRSSQTDPFAEQIPRRIVPAYPTDDCVVADIDLTGFKGLDATGVSDATDVIQMAIDACYERGGGTVWLPAGKYRITDVLLVSPFVTLRGDWRDPDTKGKGYGTVLVADVPSSDALYPGVVRIGGSAGVVGLTFYYPNQDAEKPVPYPYTIEIPGRAWLGDENYMAQTVRNCTLLNAYRGIGVSITPSDHGRSVRRGQVHEMATICNVKGTVLKTGLEGYNEAESSNYELITFNNTYWANAGKAYDPPSLDVLSRWTARHTTGLVIGDLEWSKFTGIALAGLHTGIRIAPGQRTTCAINLVDATIEQCEVALDQTAVGRGYQPQVLISGSKLSGNQYAVRNTNRRASIQLANSTTKGKVASVGVTIRDAANPKRRITYATLRQQAGTAFINAAAAPYRAPRAMHELPAADAARAIQSALNAAGKRGGGLVYLPAGWYRVSGHLEVPAGVELRGSSCIPARDNVGRSLGTVLMAYQGRDHESPDDARAFITLKGKGAGVSGLRVLYPENNPAEAIHPYPFTIRGEAADQYVVNAGFVNSWNGIDFKNRACDNHLVKGVTGCFFHRGIRIGASSGGRIENCLFNGTASNRVEYNIPNWVKGNQLFPRVFAHTKANLHFIVVDGAMNLTINNTFSYGAKHGLVVRNATVHIPTLGSDGNTGGTCVVAGENARVHIDNFMKYGGPAAAGNVTFANTWTR